MAGSRSLPKSQSASSNDGPSDGQSLKELEKLNGCLFRQDTKAIVWGLQNRAIQGMLDFDYVCSRKTPSVVAILYPLV